jgi:hypothetical protein
MYRKNATRNTKKTVAAKLELGSEVTEGKCLGLSIYVGRSKTQCFEYITQKIWKIIQGWKEKLMSMVAK